MLLGPLDPKPGRVLGVLGPRINATDVLGRKKSAKILHPCLKLAEVAVHLPKAARRPFTLRIWHPADSFKGIVLGAALSEGLQDRFNAAQFGHGIVIVDDRCGSGKYSEHGIARLLAARPLEAGWTDLGDLGVDGFSNGQARTRLLNGAKQANCIWSVFPQEAKYPKGFSSGRSNRADGIHLAHNMGQVGEKVVLLGALIAAGAIILFGDSAVLLRGAFVADGRNRLQFGQIDERSFEVLVGLVAHRAVGHVAVRALHAGDAEFGQLAEGLGPVERPRMDAWENLWCAGRADMGEELLGQVVARHVLELPEQGMFDRNLASKGAGVSHSHSSWNEPRKSRSVLLSERKSRIFGPCGSILAEPPRYTKCRGGFCDRDTIS